LKIWSGLFTALITPFDDQGALDQAGLRLLVRLQKEAEVDGLVVLGSTGEAPTLTSEEKEIIIRLTKEEAGSLPILVGCGGYDTQKVIENVHQAAHLGAQGALIVTPYYNKPTQEGLYLHFQALSRASPLPLILYNIPGRTGVNVLPETLKKIADLPSIVGVKEASGNVVQMGDIIAEIKAARPSFSLFSGDDIFTFPLMALGGDGLIGMSSNLIPRLMKKFMSAFQVKDWELARTLHYQLLPLFKGVTMETNPIPIKAAMQMAGLPSGSPRLPLTPLSPVFRETLTNIVDRLYEKT